MQKLAGAAGPGWENQSHHLLILKMLSFFSAFSLRPQEGRICAATSDFVATSIFPPPWGHMGPNGDKCRLLLFEDPVLEAQPRHEVAFGVVPAPPPPSRGQNV